MAFPIPSNSKWHSVIQFYSVISYTTPFTTKITRSPTATYLFHSGCCASKSKYCALPKGIFVVVIFSGTNVVSVHTPLRRMNALSPACFNFPSCDVGAAFASPAFDLVTFLLAAEVLRTKLAEISFAAQAFPVVNNIDVAVADSADALRDALYRQAFGPVRWVEVVQALRARGLGTIVECGPGKVLAGMVKRIDGELNGLALFDPATLTDVKAALA